MFRRKVLEQRDCVYEKISQYLQLKSIIQSLQVLFLLRCCWSLNHVKAIKLTAAGLQPSGEASQTWLAVGCCKRGNLVHSICQMIGILCLGAFFFFFLLPCWEAFLRSWWVKSEASLHVFHAGVWLSKVEGRCWSRLQLLRPDRSVSCNNSHIS